MTQTLEIIDYFESLVEKIHHKAQKILTKTPHKYHGYVNEKRKSFTDEIEQVKQYNLSNLTDEKTDIPFNKEDVFKKYCFCLDMDKWNGHRFILNGDFYHETPDQAENQHDDSHMETVIDKAFGVLIILDGYLSDRKLSLFKELLHFHTCYFPYEQGGDENKFDLFNESHRARVSYLLEQKFKYCPYEIGKTSLVFKSKSYDLNQIYWSIWLQYEMFKKPNGFIIKTNKRDLFRVNYLYLNNITIDSINYEALELLGDQLSLIIEMNPNSKHVIIDSVSFVKLLETHLNVNMVNMSIDDNLNLINDVEVTSCLSDVQNLHELIIFNSEQGLIFNSPTNAFSNLNKLRLISKNESDNQALDVANLVHNLAHLEELSISSFNSVILDGLASVSNLTELRLISSGISAIRSRQFDHLPSLNLLDLSWNKIRSIEEDAFAGLDKLKYLDLSQNKLKSLASMENLQNLTDLNVKFNKLASLESGALKGLSNLEKLKLDGNYIVRIDEQSFDHTPGLKNLKLTGNKGLRLTQHTFEKLNRLEKLDLSHCELESSGDIHLNGLVNLKKLYLQYNEIQSLERDMFAGLTNLLLIDLSFNRITKIDQRAFDANLESVINLQLIGNDITHLDESSFDNLTNLAELGITCKNFTSLKFIETNKKLLKLDLSYSNIFEIEPEFNEKLANVRSLTLNHNRIGVLAANMLSALGHLERLSISANQIQNVDELAFEGLTNLRYLDLSKNEINHVWLHGVPNLQQLSLGSNRIENLDFLNTLCLSNLKYLNLRDNHVKRIGLNCFGCLHKLVALNLEKNSLNEIDAYAFRDLACLRKLKLGTNPIMKTINSYLFSKLNNLKNIEMDHYLNQ